MSSRGSLPTTYRFEYYPHIDVLANATQCSLDAPSLKALGANTVLVGYLETEANHNGCMKAFAEANIHVIVRLAPSQPIPTCLATLPWASSYKIGGSSTVMPLPSMHS